MVKRYSQKKTHSEDYVEEMIEDSTGEWTRYDAEAEKLIREVLEGGRLRSTLWEAAALKWLGEDRVYCGCLNPIWKVWHDNSIYCTACGNYQRAGGVEHG